MDIAALLNSAITFAVIMGIFILFDWKFAKQRRFKNKSWKFWAGLFAIYMVITYIIYLVRP